ncbi:MAG: bifunctional oligoribonuclease/PAP phosphatase NrnA [Flavobacteriaceae bacterium]|nr:bifunctional oligoribonuclease/PAP phosphatase NrnA [Flavobacteriaceae bacterium]
MTREDFKDIKKKLAIPKKIVIVSHKNPDGDAIGSSLGLYHYLKQYGHEVTPIVPNDFPDFLKWTPGVKDILIYDQRKEKANTLFKEADIVFTLDFNAFHRTGDVQHILNELDTCFIMIDHHQQPDDYATYMYSDVAICSTSQMIYHFIDGLDDTDKINADIASALYLGIMTDTGSFRFRSTDSQTHRVVAELIDKGADNTAIHEAVYDANSHNRLLLLGRALSKLTILPEHNTAYIALSKSDLLEFNYQKGDTEALVNYALSVKGIQIAALFKENLDDSDIRISFRSKGDFSVNTMARDYFNGGGHTNAAGAVSTIPLKDTIDKFISILDGRN